MGCRAIKDIMGECICSGDSRTVSLRKWPLNWPLKAGINKLKSQKEQHVEKPQGRREHDIWRTKRQLEHSAEGMRWDWRDWQRQGSCSPQCGRQERVLNKRRNQSNFLTAVWRTEKKKRMDRRRPLHYCLTWYKHPHVLSSGPPNSNAQGLDYWPQQEKKPFRRSLSTD